MVLGLVLRCTINEQGESKVEVNAADATASDNKDNAATDKELVPKEAYDGVTQDLMRHKSKTRELEEKLKAYESEKESLRLKGLKDRDEWQKIAEEKERQVETLSQKLDASRSATESYFKRSEIKNQAIKAGIKESAMRDLDLLPLDEVVIETTSTGSINIIGADKFIDRQKMERPHWFGKGQASQVDTTAPGVGHSKAFTASDLLRLQREGKQKEYESALLQMSKQRSHRG